MGSVYDPEESFRRLTLAMELGPDPVLALVEVASPRVLAALRARLDVFSQEAGRPLREPPGPPSRDAILEWLTEELAAAVEGPEQEAAQRLIRLVVLPEGEDRRFVLHRLNENRNKILGGLRGALCIVGGSGLFQRIPYEAIDLWSARGPDVDFQELALPPGVKLPAAPETRGEAGPQGGRDDSPPPASEVHVDVLFLAALQDELDGILMLGGDPGAWKPARDRHGFRYYYREILNDRGLPLRFGAAWTGDSGETAAATRAQGLIDELDPRAVALSGICAGMRGEVFLGDVIVADRVYSYDHGKLVAADEGRRVDFYHDITTYNLDPAWKMEISLLAREAGWKAGLLAARPVSRQAQGRWLLHAIYEHESLGGAPPQNRPERRERCPDWTEVLQRLRQQGYLELVGGALRLTPSGRERVEEERIEHPDGLPGDPPFQVHIGAIATGKPVQEDPDIFERLRRHVRKTIGLEMEGAAVGYVAERLGRRFIIVKSVSDFADADKDDSFRSFACRASAELLLTFFRRCFEPDLPRGRTAAANIEPGMAVRGEDIRSAFQMRDPRDQGRELLQRVMDICRARDPEARIQTCDAPPPFGAYLEVTLRQGRYLNVSPVAALDGPIDDEALNVFLDAIDAPYRRRNPYFNSTLVYSGSEPPPDVQRRAEARGVRLQSFVEYQQLIDWSGYLQRQTRRLSTDPVYPPSLYVEQRAKVRLGLEERLTEDAAGDLIDLLRSPHPRFVLLLGEFGTGKTFLLREVARRMGASNAVPVPVLIDMRALEKSHDLGNLIAQHLHQAGVQPLNVTAFRYMLAEGSIALLIDGFDELAFRVTYDRAVEHFDTLLDAAQGNAKVVISSRTQHFFSDQDVRTALARRAEQIPGHRVMTLERFSEDQIRRFLVRRMGSEDAADRRLELLGQIQDLMGLAQNPRMLGFIAELEEEKLREAKGRLGEITAAELYRLLLDRWLVTEFERAHPRGAPPGLSLMERWRAVEELARRLWLTTARVIEPQALPEELRSVVDALGSTALDGAVAAHQIGSGTLLVRDKEGRFSFLHHSVLEWLVARQAADELRESAEPSLLGQGTMSDLMADFLIDLVRDATRVRRWACSSLATQDRPAAKQNALAVLRALGRRGGGGQEMVTLPEVGAGIEEMDLRGQDLSGADLSGADLRRADLSGASLRGAKLERARLGEARLRGSDLSDANLVEADLSGAVLDGARLLRADLRQASLHGARMQRAKLCGARIDTLEGVDVRGAALPQPESLKPTWSSGDALAAIAFRPDGEILATGDYHGVVRLWDVAAGMQVRSFQGSSAAIQSMSFSPDAVMLAYGGYDGDVRWLNCETGEVLRRPTGRPGGVAGVAFSLDGSLLATGSDLGTLLLWDTTAGQPAACLRESGERVASMSFVDAGLLAVGLAKGLIEIWDTSARQIVQSLKEHGREVLGIDVNQSKGLLASTTADGLVILWDIRSGMPERILRSPWLLRPDGGMPVSSVCFSPDGELLAAGFANGGAALWELETGAHVPKVVALGGDTLSSGSEVRFSPDGQLLAVTSHVHGLLLHDVSRERDTKLLRAAPSAIHSLAFISAGGAVVVGARDGTVSLWETATGRRLWDDATHAGMVLGMAFSPDGGTWASCGHEGTVVVRRTGSRDMVRTLRFKGRYLDSITFSPDGKSIAAGGLGGLIQLWDVQTGRSLQTLEASSSPGMYVGALAYRPGTTTLVSGDTTGEILVWEPAVSSTPRLLGQLSPMISRLAFSPDGRLLACAYQSNTAAVWDFASSQPAFHLQGHTGRVLTVAFSPDGQRLATGAMDTTVRLWDASSGHELAVLEGHLGFVYSVAFHPDGRHLASGSSDGTVRLWDLTTRACLAVLLNLPEGWVAFTPDGRYKLGGDVAGSFWHAINLCRFEPGELDEVIPGLRLAADEPFLPQPA